MSFLPPPLPVQLLRTGASQLQAFVRSVPKTTTATVPGSRPFQPKIWPDALREHTPALSHLTDVLYEKLPPLPASTRCPIHVIHPFRDEVQVQAGKIPSQFDTLTARLKPATLLALNSGTPFEIGANLNAPELGAKDSFVTRFQRDMSFSQTRLSEVVARLHQSPSFLSYLQRHPFRLLVLTSKNPEASAQLVQNYITIATALYGLGIRVTPFFLTYACEVYSDKNSKMTPTDSLVSIKAGWTQIQTQMGDKIGFMPPLGVYLSGPLGVYASVKATEGLSKTLPQSRTAISYLADLSPKLILAFGDTAGLGTPDEFQALIRSTEDLPFIPEFHLHHNALLPIPDDMVRLTRILSGLLEYGYGRFHIGTGSGGSPFSKDPGAILPGLYCNLLGELPLLMGLKTAAPVNSRALISDKKHLLHNQLLLSLFMNYRSPLEQSHHLMAMVTALQTVFK